MKQQILVYHSKDLPYTYTAVGIIIDNQLSIGVAINNQNEKSRARGRQIAMGAATQKPILQLNLIAKPKEEHVSVFYTIVTKDLNKVIEDTLNKALNSNKGVDLEKFKELEEQYG